MNLETSMISDVPAGRRPVVRAALPEPDPDHPHPEVIVIDIYGVFTTCSCGALRDPLRPCPRCGR
jgi:hypothetical protein